MAKGKINPADMPRRVKVGPLWYRIEFCADTGNLGINKVFPRPRILIDPQFDHQVQVATLIHEILHAVFDATGHQDLNKDEGLVERVANAWTTTLLETPGLLEFLAAQRNREDGDEG